MLVLGTNDGGSIFIGDNIEVVLVKSRKGHARLGVKAPKEIPVNREKVHKRIQSKAEGVNVA